MSIFSTEPEDPSFVCGDDGGGGGGGGGGETGAYHTLFLMPFILNQVKLLCACYSDIGY